MVGESVTSSPTMRPTTSDNSTSSVLFLPHRGFILSFDCSLWFLFLFFKIIYLFIYSFLSVTIDSMSGLGVLAGNWTKFWLRLLYYSFWSFCFSFYLQCTRRVNLLLTGQLENTFFFKFTYWIPTEQCIWHWFVCLFVFFGYHFKCMCLLAKRIGYIML